MQIRKADKMTRPIGPYHVLGRPAARASQCKLWPTLQAGSQLQLPQGQPCSDSHHYCVLLRIYIYVNNKYGIPYNYVNNIAQSLPYLVYHSMMNYLLRYT